MCTSSARVLCDALDRGDLSERQLAAYQRVGVPAHCLVILCESERCAQSEDTTPTGQLTPVPPRPQYPLGFLALTHSVSALQ